MIPINRRRNSSPESSGDELNQTVQAIKKLITKWQAEGECAEVVKLKNVLNMLVPMLEGSHIMAYEHLDKLNISLSDVLKLKPDCTLHAAETNSFRENEHWSADGLYHHLCMLEGLVPCTNEAAARLWINAFFFRVASMLPSSSKIVLNVEQNFLPIAPNPTLSGFVNFTAILTTEEHARLLFKNPKPKILSVQDHVLFVAEAKGPNQMLESHVPQAICEMYACAKYLNKMIIRGALTNGHKWIFLILKLNEDGNGGIYFPSDDISIMLGVNRGVSQQGSSLIAAIITHWIQHSHEDIGTDDYFEPS